MFKPVMEGIWRERPADLEPAELKALGQLEKAVYFHKQGFQKRFSGPFARLARLWYGILHDEPVSTDEDVWKTAEKFVTQMNSHVENIGDRSENSVDSQP
jgi:hypothetical protein